LSSHKKFQPLLIKIIISIEKLIMDMQLKNLHKIRPNFDEIGIYVLTYEGCKAYFDNIKLENTEKKTEAAEEGFIRIMSMTCYQVWVNSDNKFEMVFWMESYHLKRLIYFRYL
jgi:hypothetical protein